MVERIFHRYDHLEEFHAGMWRIVRGEARKTFIAAAADLMQQPSDFRDAMLRALTEWPTSCEANLTAESVNRLAWLGHAGCCIVTGSPEEATRVAWHTLDPDQQRVANNMADEVLQVYLRQIRMANNHPDLFDGLSA